MERLVELGDLQRETQERPETAQARPDLRLLADILPTILSYDSIVLY